MKISSIFNIYIVIKIYLTPYFSPARDEARGLAAIKDLQTEGLSPHFHLLDITDHDSIVTLRDFLQREYRGLDLLVNNAAVLFYVGEVLCCV